MYDYETRALRGDGVFPAYLAYPRFLLKEKLNDTVKLLYILLLERGRLSANDPKWQDQNGCAFVYYTAEELAAVTGRSKAAVRRGLDDLEEANLIRKQRQGQGKPLKIFLRIPVDSAASLRDSPKTREKKSSSRFSTYGYGIPTL